MSRRRSLATALSCWLLATIAISCAEPTRHKVLSFFFDGVPAPGGSAPEGTEPGPTMEPADDLVATATRPAQPTFAHEPYRTGACSRCHDAESGGLVRGLDAGLCRMCHGGIDGELRYVHGPVAVDACTYCHHYHSAFRPNLLLREPRALCLSCHEVADLTEGSHHQDLDGACTDCHDPHGGADRYFLRRNEP